MPCMSGPSSFLASPESLECWPSLGFSNTQVNFSVDLCRGQTWEEPQEPGDSNGMNLPLSGGLHVGILLRYAMNQHLWEGQEAWRQKEDAHRTCWSLCTDEEFSEWVGHSEMSHPEERSPDSMNLSCDVVSHWTQTPPRARVGRRELPTNSPRRPVWSIVFSKGPQRKASFCQCNDSCPCHSVWSSSAIAVTASAT